MAKKFDFPPLTAGDIDTRIATFADNYLDLLLYKDARVDMRMLDEAVGAKNWQRSHQTIDGVNYCTVSIWDEEKSEWISKQDCGTAGEFEAAKGSASDAFKRACFNWGIGRELYTIPAIRLWHSDQLYKISQGKNGKQTTYDKFKVSKLVVEDHVVKELIVVNESNGKVVFRLDGNTPQQAPAEPTEKPSKTTKKKAVDVEKNKAVLRLKKALEDYCERTGADLQKSTEGIKKRPDYKETADYLNAVAEEFENGM